MRLTMLGTGEAIVTECYNTCFVLHEDNRYFMVDGGGGIGILGQLKRAGFSWMEMREIFITHRHTDHLLGVLWLIRVIGQAMHRGEYLGEVHIYGHEEVLLLLRKLADLLLSPSEAKWVDKRIHLVVVSDGETRIINDRTVTFFDIRSFKAKQFGFSMALDNGKRLTCCGDEPYQPHEEPYVKGCTWLLHEAFCLHSEAELFHPYEIHHSTVKDACETAAALDVENLVLYHTEDKNILKRKLLYREEGARYYTGNLYIPDDLETLEL